MTPRPDHPVGHVRYPLVRDVLPDEWVVERVETIGRFPSREEARQWMIDTTDERQARDKPIARETPQEAVERERYEADAARAVELYGETPVPQQGPPAPCEEKRAARRRVHAIDEADRLLRELRAAGHSVPEIDRVRGLLAEWRSETS